jgi:hypothetical protein
VGQLAADAAADAGGVALQHLGGEKRRDIRLAPQIHDARPLGRVGDDEFVVDPGDGRGFLLEPVAGPEILDHLQPGGVDELVEARG